MVVGEGPRVGAQQQGGAGGPGGGHQDRLRPTPRLPLLRGDVVPGGNHCTEFGLFKGLTLWWLSSSLDKQGQLEC